MNNKNGKERPWLLKYDPGVPYHLLYTDDTLVSLLDTAAHLYKDRSITIFRDSHISYSELASSTDKLALALIELGIKPGDRIAVMLPNIPQFVTVFFGILKAGGIVVAINPLYTSPEIETQANDAGVKLIIVLATLYQKVKELQNRTCIQTVVVTQFADRPRSNLHDRQDLPTGPEYIHLSSEDSWLEDLIGRSSDQIRPFIRPEDPAIFQYSGGTTGIPKAAIGTHRNLVSNAFQTRAWLTNCRDGEEMVLMAIPLFHVYGMVFGMIYAIASGASLLLTENGRDTDELLALIQKYRPTIFPGVPAMYINITNHADVVAGKADLHSIKACISGSAPLLRETKGKFESLTGGRLCEGYGLSEAPTATHCNPLMGENRVGSIGLPYPDVDARIVDLETGTIELPVGETGELIIKGPQVMKGYHCLPDETALALRNSSDGSGPWLYTGDIARMDPQGYFYIIDRKKELIKPNGLQVWPSEVEKVLSANPEVLDVGVAGVDDPGRGEVVKAWVVLKPGVVMDAAALQAWCHDRLSSYKIPAMIEFVERLPRTSIGKLLRRELRSLKPDK